MLKPRLSLDEIARLGDAIHERDVLPTITEADKHSFVAIDVISGAFAIDADELTALHRVLDQHPEGQLWLARVGRRYAHRMPGFRRISAEVPTRVAPTD
jgi:hypothetical protein